MGHILGTHYTIYNGTLISTSTWNFLKLNIPVKDKSNIAENRGVLTGHQFSAFMSLTLEGGRAGN
jgi:hypothetical protein